MSNHGLPVMVNIARESIDMVEHDGMATVFERVPLEDVSIGESWLQRMLFRHPEILPISDLDQMFAPLRALAREVPTGVGPIDLLGVSPSGFLTVVETKLHRNPESRREVLGQILDYCGQLSRWSYGDLVEAVRNAKHRASDAPDPVLFAAKGSSAPLADQKRFQSTVTESLRHGRFLLMIVGDSFRESTTDLLEYVQKSMHLQFTIRLVELRLFSVNASRDHRLLIVPQLVARTREVTRAIVRIQHHVDPADVTIEGVADQDTSPGFEQFVEHLTMAHGIGNEFASMVSELAPFGIYADATKDGVQLRWPDPHGTGQQFRILRARRNGEARISRVKGQLDHWGYDSSPALTYIKQVASWAPGVSVDTEGRVVGPNGATRDIPLRLLVSEKREEFLAAVKRLLDEITAAPKSAGANRPNAGDAPGADQH